MFNGLADTTATLGSFYWLGFETSGLSPDKKRLAYLGAQRLKCGTAGERRPERSELAALTAVATTDLFATGLIGPLRSALSPLHDCPTAN